MHRNVLMGVNVPQGYTGIPTQPSVYHVNSVLVIEMECIILMEPFERGNAKNGECSTDCVILYMDFFVL